MQQNLKPLEEVLNVLEKAAIPVGDRETVPLDDAGGRILAQNLIAPFDVPTFDNSRMDGYAARAADCTSPLPISQVIGAGDQANPLKQGTAARIFTGAPLPQGADTVVMQEDTSSDGETVTFLEPVTAGRHIGQAGEDIATGANVLSTGHRLQPQDLGLAASIGCQTLDVFRRPRVAFFSTGDELKQPGETLEVGQIYNSNRYLLRALIERTGCEPVDLGIIPDHLEDTKNALQIGAANADVVITSGGVSVGERDFLREALDLTGKLNLWRIRIKPGKPLVFGDLNKTDGSTTPYLGLPGNPVSVFVTFLMLARPFLFKRAGAANIRPDGFKIPAGFERLKPATRREFLRCRLEEKGGQLMAVPYDNQSSAVLTSTSHSDGLAVFREETTISKGDLVDFFPYVGLFG